jgi:hypothetical protein
MQTVAAANSTIASGNRMLGDFNHFVMEDRATAPFSNRIKGARRKGDKENCEPVILQRLR